MKTPNLQYPASREHRTTNLQTHERHLASTRQWNLKFGASLVLGAWCLMLPSAFAQGTAFTYQGRLSDGGSPADGSYDLTFALYTTNVTGSAIAGPVTNNAVPVTNGLFTTTVDFGKVFTGGSNWLQIAVSTNGANAFSPLLPRLQLTPVPYAITAENVLGGGLAAGTYGNAVTLNNAANQFTGSFTGNGANVTNVNAGSLGGLASSNFWQLGGNSGNPNTLLGTLDNAPLNIFAGNQRLLRLETIQRSTGIGGSSVAGNLTGGADANLIWDGVLGGTIAGGGSSDYTFPLGKAPHPNVVSDDFGTIGGGADNLVGNTNADLTDVHAGTIGGGERNVVSASFATVGGGNQNTASGGNSFIGSGLNNSASGGNAVIGGGANNIADNNAAVIAGGSENHASGDHTTVGGGQGNISAGDYTTVSGGLDNTAPGNAAMVGGGFINNSSGPEATVGGGYANTSSGAWAMVGGGAENNASGSYATVGGGGGNQASGPGSVVGGGGFDGLLSVGNVASGGASVIAGGMGNIATNSYATVGGGDENTASGFYTTVGGGGFNSASFSYSTVAGGGSNTASNNFAAVSGGYGNTAAGNATTVAGGAFNSAGRFFDYYSAVGGGYYNAAVSYAATVGGGSVNQATNYCATVPGGNLNIAGGPYSFAAGQKAQALHQGSFVWADSQNAVFASTTSNQFNIRAMNGVCLATDTSLFFGSGAKLWPDQGGSIELGDSLAVGTAPYIDFHYGRGIAQDANVRLINDADGQLTLSGNGRLSFGTITRQMLNLWSTNYGIGVQSQTTYFRSDFGFSWFKGGSHNDNPNNPGTGGTELMRLASNGNLNIAGSFGSLSDRNAKEQFEPVDPREVLEKVNALPLSRWSYKTDPASRHVGPMAQDFHAAFGLNGNDDKHIATVDEEGVGLAAIQGLNQRLNEKDAEIQELKQRLEALEQIVLKPKSN